METQCYICPRCHDDHEPDMPCAPCDKEWWEVVRERDAKIKRLRDALDYDETYTAAPALWECLGARMVEAGQAPVPDGTEEGEVEKVVAVVDVGGNLCTSAIEEMSGDDRVARLLRMLQEYGAHKTSCPCACGSENETCDCGMAEEMVWAMGLLTGECCERTGRWQR